MKTVRLEITVKDEMYPVVLAVMHDVAETHVKHDYIDSNVVVSDENDVATMTLLLEDPSNMKSYEGIGHAGSVLQDFTNAFVDQSRAYYRDRRHNAMKKSAMDKLREAFYDEPEKVAFIEQFLKGNEPPESNDPLVAFTATSIFDNAPENIKRMTGSINDALRYALFHATMTDEGKKGTD